MLSLRLSSLLLLTLKPSASKLPILTRLPSETVRYCLCPSVPPESEKAFYLLQPPVYLFGRKSLSALSSPDQDKECCLLLKIYATAFHGLLHSDIFSDRV